MDIDNPEINSATATTQTTGDNSTKVATTAYVDTTVVTKYVPYTGATGDVDLGANSLTSDEININNDTNPSIKFNNTSGTQLWEIEGDQALGELNFNNIGDTSVLTLGQSSVTVDATLRIGSGVNIILDDSFTVLDQIELAFIDGLDQNISTTSDVTFSKVSINNATSTVNFNNAAGTNEWSIESSEDELFIYKDGDEVASFQDQGVHIPRFQKLLLGEDASISLFEDVNVLQVELRQVANLNGTVITAGQWVHLSKADQDTGTTDSVVFSEVNVNNGTLANVNFNNASGTQLFKIEGDLSTAALNIKNAGDASLMSFKQSSLTVETLFRIGTGVNIILADSSTILDQTELAFIDGLDQNLSTTSDVVFSEVNVNNGTESNINFNNASGTQIFKIEGDQSTDILNINNASDISLISFEQTYITVNSLLRLASGVSIFLNDSSTFLSQNELAFIDGLDQNVSTTSDVKFNDIETTGDILMNGLSAIAIGGDNTNTPDTSPDAQLVLDGQHNTGYNSSAKLLIRGFDNEANVEVIKCQDENANNIFTVNSIGTTVDVDGSIRTTGTAEFEGVTSLGGAQGVGEHVRVVRSGGIVFIEAENSTVTDSAPMRITGHLGGQGDDLQLNFAETEVTGNMDIAGDVTILDSGITGISVTSTTNEAFISLSSNNTQPWKMYTPNVGNDLRFQSDSVDYLTLSTTGSATFSSDVAMGGDLDMQNNDVYLRNISGSKYGMAYDYASLGDMSIVSDNNITFVESDNDVSRGVMALNSGDFIWYGDFEVQGDTRGIPQQTPPFVAENVGLSYIKMNITNSNFLANPNRRYVVTSPTSFTHVQLNVDDDANTDSYTIRVYRNGSVITTVTFTDPGDFDDNSTWDDKIGRKLLPASVDCSEGDWIGMEILASSASNLEIVAILDGKTNG